MFDERLNTLEWVAAGAILVTVALLIVIIVNYAWTATNGKPPLWLAITAVVPLLVAALTVPLVWERNVQVVSSYRQVEWVVHTGHQLSNFQHDPDDRDGTVAILHRDGGLTATRLRSMDHVHGPVRDRDGIWWQVRLPVTVNRWWTFGDVPTRGCFEVQPVSNRTLVRSC